MARKLHHNEHSNEESHLRFKQVVAQLGMRTSPLTDLVNNVRVDGVRMGDRLAELRKPDRTFYAQSYTEANAVAHLIVRLELQDHVLDLRRLEPPKPDIKVIFDDRPAVYVEQTMVMDEAARRLSNAVEEINYAVRHSNDALAQAVFDGGLFFVRIERLTVDHYERGFDVTAMAAEIIALARSINGDSVRTSVAATFPLLHEVQAVYSYRHGARTGSVLQMLVDHGRPQFAEAALRGQIRKKIGAAASYPPDCRPLWLLLDIDHHFGLNDFTRLAHSVIDEENPTEFDRVIVQSTYFNPLVLDLN